MKVKLTRNLKIDWENVFRNTFENNKFLYIISHRNLYFVAPSQFFFGFLWCAMCTSCRHVRNTFFSWFPLHFFLHFLFLYRNLIFSSFFLAGFSLFLLFSWIVYSHACRCYRSCHSTRCSSTAWSVTTT